MSITCCVNIDFDNDSSVLMDAILSLFKHTPVHLHYFTSVYEPTIAEHASSKDAKHALTQEALEKLKRMTTDLTNKLSSVTVDHEVAWHETPNGLLLQASARVGADFVITLPLTPTEELKLLRNSACPVLRLTANAKPRNYTRLLAAVAIEADNDAHDLLNNRIIITAQQLSRATQAKVHVVAALQDTLNIQQILKISKNADEERLSNEGLISERFGVESERIFADYGPTKKVIQEAIIKSKADLLVIGTIARTGISGALIGNTCESLLDTVDTDLLIVN